MKTAFWIWVCDDDEMIDQLIEELEKMKWWKPFIYAFWPDTKENRDAQVEAYKNNF